MTEINPHFTNLYELSLKEPNPFLVLDPSQPKITICHHGGEIPDTRPGSEHGTFLDIRFAIRETIGMGSLLCWGNPNGKTLVEFGDEALEQRELWAARTYYVTLFFYDVHHNIHLAFAHDRRFHLSWPERNLPFTYFTAQGSVYDWYKFLQHKDDQGFKEKQRQLLTLAWGLWQLMLPELFN